MSSFSSFQDSLGPKEIQPIHQPEEGIKGAKRKFSELEEKVSSVKGKASQDIDMGGERKIIKANVGQRSLDSVIKKLNIFFNDVDKLGPEDMKETLSKIVKELMPHVHTKKVWECLKQKIDTNIGAGKVVLEKLQEKMLSDIPVQNAKAIFEFLLTTKHIGTKDIPNLLDLCMQSKNADLFTCIINKVGPTKEGALKLLESIIAQGDFALAPNIFMELIDRAGISGADVLNMVEKNTNFKNYQLLTQIILRASGQEVQDKMLQRIVKFLIKNKDFDGAQRIVNDVRGEGVLPYKRRKTTFEQTKEDVKVLLQYTHWSLLHYNSSDRFKGLSRETIQSCFKERSVDSSESCSRLAKIVDKDKLDFIGKVGKFVQPLLKKEKTDEKWMLDNKVDVRLAKKEGWLSFVKDSKLYEAQQTFGHAVEFDKDSIPQILVDGKLTSLEAVLEDFKIDLMQVGAINLPVIVNKETGEQWSYLEKGLVPHNQRTSLASHKTVKGDGKYYVSFVCTNHGNTKTAEGIKRLFSAHAWMKLQDGDGKVYSVGRFSDGGFLSPDMFEYKRMSYDKPAPVLENRVEVSEEKFNELKNQISRSMKNPNESFNLLQTNCSSFTGQVAASLLPAVSSSTTYGEHNTFETRIKLFAASKEVAETIVNNGKTLQERIDKQKSSEPGYAYFQLLDLVKEKVSDDEKKETIEFLKAVPYNADLLDKLDAAIVDALKEVRKDSRETLVNKIYNLITDVYSSIEKDRLDHPYSLYLSIKKVQDERANQVGLHDLH